MTLDELVGQKVGLVFPGQGSQVVGMGRALADASPVARRVIEQADDLLGFSLSRLSFEGPAEELEDTVNSQPAILTTSVAAYEAVKERAQTRGLAVVPIVTAGHSLGELTALYAAGVLDFPTVLRLVRSRGQYMKEAGEERPGGMAAVLGLDDATLEEVCAEARSEGIVVVANANCPGQTVISGEIEALTRAMELAKTRGAKRVARLKISIASHSPLMASASARLSALIGDLQFNPPQVPIVANVSGESMTTVDEIREELAQQLERPVNWTRSVQTMVRSGVATFVEIGPSQVLAGLIKRISPDVPTLRVGDLGVDLPDA